MGEATYGYTSVQVGEMRIDRRGRPRPDGYRMVIEPSEAEVVLRIFRDFGNRKAIKSLVKDLNSEEVRGRRKLRRGWSASTVSRILKNEKYVGRWTWNRTETRYPGERCLHRSAPPLGHAPEDRQVGALQRPGAAVICELRRERLVGKVVLGHHEQA